MADLTGNKAAFVSQSHVAKGVYRPTQIIDQFSCVLEQHAINGYKLIIPVVDQEPIAETFKQNLTGSDTVRIMEPQSMTPTSDPLTFGLYRFGGDIEVFSQIADTYTNLNDIRAQQIEFKGSFSK